MRFAGALLILFCLMSPAAAEDDYESSDAVRFVEIFNGEQFGEWSMTQTAPDTWRYEARRAQSFDRIEELVLDSDGLPVRIEASGQIQGGVPWFEYFSRDGGNAQWMTPRERGQTQITIPAFYASVYPAHDLGVLARALLRREDRTLALLPGGAATLQEIDELTVTTNGQARTVHLFQIRGINLLPDYVWLDEDNQTFADELSVLKGWEGSFSALRDAVEGAIAAERNRLLRAVNAVEVSETLLIRDVRVFDAYTGKISDQQSILVEGNRIIEVGSSDAITACSGATIIEGKGRVALPGLWDVHGHFNSPGRNSQIERRGSALLNIAAGVTTVRDVGSDIEALRSLAAQIEAGQAIGPRVLKAGLLSSPTYKDDIGIAINGAEDARAAVDRYADLGYDQIKLYPVDLEAAYAAIARAKERGLGVTGHLPDDMTTRDAVAAGYDQLMHIWWIALLADRPNRDLMDAGETWDTWYQLLAARTPDSETVQGLLDFLEERKMPIDTTIGYIFNSGSPRADVASQIDRFPPIVRRRLEHRVPTPGYHPVSPLARASYEQARHNLLNLLLMLHQRGVPLMPGTDTWPGFGLHFELELYEQAGISATDILSLATLGAARAFGMADQLGSIEKGKLADIILVEGRPDLRISDIRRVSLVVKDGKIFDPSAIYGTIGLKGCCDD